MNLRSTRYTINSIVGRSQAIDALKAEAIRAAANPVPVLITGESGTGKELFAQAIHHAGPRKLYPFVRINCAAMPKDLIESELFGYEKGAFTGARADGKPGKFELAHSGNVFLDEVGDMPIDMQPKLLRVLEDKEFERIEKTAILRALEEAEYNKSRAADTLGIHRTLLYKKMKKYGISPQPGRTDL